MQKSEPNPYGGKAHYEGLSTGRLAKMNERLKLGIPGRALNGGLWVEAAGKTGACVISG